MKLPMLDLMLKIEPLLFTKQEFDYYDYICNCADKALGIKDKFIWGGSKGFFQKNHPRFYKWIMKEGIRLGKLNRGEEYEFYWRDAWALSNYGETQQEQKLKIFNEKLNQLKAERKRRSK